MARAQIWLLPSILDQASIMIESIAAVIVPGLIGILTAGALLWRRWSRDKLEVAKDRAETDVMKHLIRQRDEAVQEAAALKSELIIIADENEEAIEQIRKLTSQNEQMKSQIRMLNILVQRLAAINNLPTGDQASSE